MQDKQNIEKYLLDKIDKGKDLNESELKSLVSIFSHTERTRGFNRGYELIATIVKLSNRYFYLEYELGGNSVADGIYYNSQLSYTFYNQPTEVHTEIRTEKHERWVDNLGQVLL